MESINAQDENGDEYPVNVTNVSSVKKAKAKQRRRGRPKGSRNRATKTVKAPLPRCAKCKSTEFIILKKISEVSVRGTTSAGEPYTSVVRRRAQCTHCGQVCVLTSYPYAPGTE